jgi:hypothetical protein
MIILFLLSLFIFVLEFGDDVGRRYMRVFYRE